MDSLQKKASGLFQLDVGQATRCMLCWLVVSGLAGCGSSNAAKEDAVPTKKGTAKNSSADLRSRPLAKQTDSKPQPGKTTDKSPADGGKKQQSVQTTSISPDGQVKKHRLGPGAARTLADLVNKDGEGGISQGRFPPVDEEKIKAAGLRKLVGKYVTIYTDLPSHPSVDELPHVFDLCVPKWIAYFKVDPKKVEGKRFIGSVIKDRERFVKAGLITAAVPDFENGFNRDDRFWVLEQPSEYYRRHLVIHEGTHGFMQLFLFGSGPAWYSEGTAEMFGTHRWSDGKLQLRYMPPDKKETPFWGRIKIVKRDLDNNKALTLRSVFAFSSIGHRDVDAYGWCWAASTFLDKHPHYQATFRALGKHANVTSERFSLVFLEQLRRLHIGPNRPSFDIHQQWQWYVYNLDYGYDVAREAIDQKPLAPLDAQGKTVDVLADRGWQSSGIHLEPGQYTLQASGRYQVGNKPKVWWCEPGGVTIRYHRGKPLGMLLAAVAPETLESGTTPLIRPMGIGLGGKVRIQNAGTLFFRINDSPTELSDNQGKLSVQVSPN